MKGRWIVEAYEAWAKDVLAIYLALHASSRGVVFIKCYRFLNPELLDRLCSIVRRYDLDNIVLVDRHGFISNRGDAVLYIYIDPYKPFLPKHTGNVIVMVKPRSGLKAFYGWKRVYLKRVEGREFILKHGSITQRVVISVDYIGLAKSPRGFLGKALNVLRRGVVDYGSLSVREAVELLMYGLGIRKDEARNVLKELVKRRYVEVKEKEVIVY